MSEEEALQTSGPLDDVRAEAPTLEDEGVSIKPERDSVRAIGYSGDAISAEDAYPITSTTPSRLVLVAGEAESGKTSLIASFYHCIQTGSLSGFHFAGSRTLLGFDERSHLACVNSGSGAQRIVRTQSGGEKCLLQATLIPSQGAKERQALFLTDVAGEYFENAANEPDQCCKIPYIGSLSRLTVLIDGARIADKRSRQSAKRRAMMLLRSLIDSGSLGRNVPVDVVFTKWDLIETCQDSTAAQRFVEDTKEAIRNSLSARIAETHFFNLAALPTGSGFRTGHGLPELVKEWMKPRDPHQRLHDYGYEQVEALTEFEKFLNREPTNLNG